MISHEGLYLCWQRLHFILSAAEGLPPTFAYSTTGPAGPNLRRFAGVSEAKPSGSPQPKW